MYSKNNLVLHTESGAYHCTQDMTTVIGYNSLANVVWLVNMDWPGDTSRQFLGLTQLFVIGATSPKPDRTRTWAKECSIHTLVLDPPEFTQYVR